MRDWKGISIHALREESDEWERQKKQAIMISIHALREESDWQPDSTLCLAFLISIHALREESDKTGNELVELTVLFQSTLSVRRATRSA